VESCRIALDRYVYEDIYPAFKAATDEKEKTARINRVFLNSLAAGGVVLTGNEPVMTADIGCGPCDTLVKYLTGVDYAGGFEIRATDYIAEYADSERGVALQTLADAQRSGLKLAGFSVKAGNAFGGDLLSLLSSPRDRMSPRNRFKLVFASHLVYHAETTAAVKRLIDDVAAILLAPDGAAILYHIANVSETFQEYRARFGSQSGGRSHSDTGAVTIDDPPCQIASACASLGLPLHEIQFTTDLRFGPLTNDEWTSFKDPLTYDRLADRKPAAYEDLKRLYFVVQRAPLEFAGDNSATGLSAFIDQVRPVIEKSGSILPLAERMQVFCRADAPSKLRPVIPEAMAAARTAA
jgi:hypothetical protein